MYFCVIYYIGYLYIRIYYNYLNIEIHIVLATEIFIIIHITWSHFFSFPFIRFSLVKSTYLFWTLCNISLPGRTHTYIYL